MGFKKIAQYIFLFIILSLLFISLDIFCRFLYLKDWYGTSTLDTTIDPIAVITLVISSIVTIFVGVFIVKSFSEQRYKKEYLISELRLIESEIHNFEIMISHSGTVPLDDVKKILNKVTLYVKRHKETLEIFKISSVENTQLKLKFRTLYSKATNVGGNELILDPATKNQLDSHCSDVIMESRKLIHIINKK